MRPGIATLALALAACGDPAFDSAFAGRPLMTITGTSRGSTPSDPRLDGSLGALRMALVWGPAEVGAGAPLAIDPLAVDALVPETGASFSLALHTPPVAFHLRSAAAGRYALGELIVYVDRDGDQAPDPSEPVVGGSRWRVAWTPDGASGRPLSAELAAGFHLVRASGPCDAEPLQLVPAPPGEEITVELGSLYDPAERFFGPTCREAATALGISYCPYFEGARWLCRYEPERDPAMCARCQRYVFPLGASPETCDAWRARCLADPPPFRSNEQRDCEPEWRACQAGEPPPADPCDLACACAADLAACLAEGLDPAFCTGKNEGCVWTE